MPNASEDPVKLTRIGVVPARAWRERRRLFAAIEAVHPVRFEGRERGALRDLDAIVVVGDEVPESEIGAIPKLVAAGEEAFQDRPGPIQVSDSPSLDRAIRGASLTERWSRPGTIGGPDGSVLATLDGLPAWVDDGARGATVATIPDELGESEALRNRLSPHRCLALLALIAFIRGLVSEHRWEHPPLRAAFVLDDPNLHWPSYGHVRYRELAQHAAEHGYHVAIAMVPLDAWPAHPAAVRLFRSRGAQLSICVHGNDHDGAELGRIESDERGVATVGQALRRATAFERRTGVPVDRVMVPPHEQLTEAAARSLLACGYEAVSASRPFPWIPRSADGPLWTSGPGEATSLAGWGTREIVAGGLPLLLRAGIDAPFEDLPLRAFLGQPLVLYGHHDLLKDGLEVLADAASAVNAVGEVRWCSLAGIARAGVATRAVGDRLEARVLAHRTALQLPPGITELELDATALELASGTSLRATITGAGRSSHARAELDAARRAVIATPGADSIEVVFDASRPARIEVPRRRIKATIRRLASEGLDRAQAIRAI